MQKPIEDYIDDSTSWDIRMGILDMQKGRTRIIDYLKGLPELNGDRKALQNLVNGWHSNGPIDVLDSGTVYRQTRWGLWTIGSDREIVISGETLPTRVPNMTNNPEIIHLNLHDLLQLDGDPNYTGDAKYPGTSQWATASSLFGNPERLDDAPFYLDITFDAKDDYELTDGLWLPKKDPTQATQVEAFKTLYNGDDWEPSAKQRKDCDLYCFFRTFDYMTREEGEREWSHIKGHESNRLDEMEKQLENYKEGRIIDTKDHRVVHALALKMIIDNPEITFEEVKARFTDFDSTNKKWTQFGPMLEDFLVKN